MLSRDIQLYQLEEMSSSETKKLQIQRLVKALVRIIQPHHKKMSIRLNADRIKIFRNKLHPNSQLWILNLYYGFIVINQIEIHLFKLFFN